MTAAFEDAVRMVTEALDSIIEFEDVCDRGSDSGGWQSEELEAAFKKVVGARAVLPALSPLWLQIEGARAIVDRITYLARLHEFGDWVLGCDKLGNVRECRWWQRDDLSKFLDRGGHSFDPVVYMPLPAAPKQEENP